MFKRKKPTIWDAAARLEEAGENAKKRTQESIEKMKAANSQLTDKEKRIMEYFWSRKKLKWRNEIPFSTLHFLINDDEPLTYSKDEVYTMLLTIQLKKYVSMKNFGIMPNYDLGGVHLETKGVDYIKDKHPKVEVLLDRFFAKIPFMVRLVAGLIGLVASILGIIDFVLNGQPYL